ncbi:hypothetical protein Mal64_15290 [Pseudobythopirellula maris]|uniref:Flagellar protein FliL n=1 Tax=Pseudobythopirellula maris TaxID=2527991 RepID=A0A5C5ZV63_9BACT|nr:flagellar basal body-associated FliL family protein [Pseudobythopirellula maris]TWT91130.1 hypothetical protein Mal64_15290 [Pseudobythopirellula maris]
MAPVVAALGACLLLAGASGCGSGEGQLKFDAIEQLPDREAYAEAEIGEFVVPIPPTPGETGSDGDTVTLMQLKFELFVLVAERDHSEVKRLARIHKNKIRDRVIRVCRSTRSDDLREEGFVTLKARLLDEIQPLLGGGMVHRLVIPVIRAEPL